MVAGRAYSDLRFEILDSAADGFDLRTEPILSMVETARLGGEPWASSWTPKLLKEELREAKLGWVGSQSEILGFVLLRFRAERAEITLVAVFPKARGAGVLDRLAAECAALSGGVDLEVRADNLHAIHAYERNGFKPVGRRPRYYSDGVDAILYSRG